MPVDRSTLPNAFQFVTVASARARQLLNGCTPRVEAGPKVARVAEREVLGGLVRAVEPGAAEAAGGAPAAPATATQEP